MIEKFCLWLRLAVIHYLLNKNISNAITYNYCWRLSQKIGSEVLMVDASRQGRSLDDTEVDICTQYVHSPVRVICHTPSKVCSDLRYGYHLQPFYHRFFIDVIFISVT